MVKNQKRNQNIKKCMNISIIKRMAYVIGVSLIGKEGKKDKYLIIKKNKKEEKFIYISILKRLVNVIYVWGMIGKEMWENKCV